MSLPNSESISKFGQVSGASSSLISSFGYIGDGVGVNNHIVNAVKLLLEQFTDDEILVGILKAFTEELNEIETVLRDLFYLRNIDDSTGEQLNIIGRIVNAPARGGLNDDEYRRLIYFTIFINQASGEWETVILFLLNTLNPVPSKIRLYGLGLLELYVVIKTSGTLPNTIVQDIQTITMSTVKVYVAQSDESDDFAFGVENGFQPDVGTLGFGETGIGYEDEGGKFVEIIF